MKSKKLDRRGLSLVELIIVIAIMAVLTGVISVQLAHYITRARKASDIYTADKIASAYMMAAALHPEVYTLMDDFREGRNSYNNNQRAYGNLKVWVSATVNGVTESYQVVLLVASEDTTWTGGMDIYRQTGFYETMNAELGLDTGPNAYNKSMIPKYKAKKQGTYSAPNGTKTYAKSVDRWRIVERIDNGAIEVWSADGSTYGGWPYYRVYPEPDDEYTK